jgi:hypothetical protein
MSTRISSILAGLDGLVAARRVHVVLDAGQAQCLARRREDGAALRQQVPDAGAGRVDVVQDLDGEAAGGQRVRRPGELRLARGHGEALVRHKRAGGRGTRCHQRASGVVDPTRVAAMGVLLRMLGIRSAPSCVNTIVARVCLNVLRSRKARREEPMGVHVPDPVISRANGTNPEEEALLATRLGSRCR